MSKYQEALEKLCKVKIYQKEASAYDYLGKEVYKEEINLINQALDRLKVLELNLDSEKYHLVNEIKCLKNRVEDLEICFKTQIKENEKRKKVIEFLKEQFEITLDSKLRISDGVDCIQAFPLLMKSNEVIYDLLKDVLENAK